MALGSIHTFMVYNREKSILPSFVVTVENTFATSISRSELVRDVTIFDIENFREINVFFHFNGTVSVNEALQLQYQYMW